MYLRKRGSDASVRNKSVINRLTDAAGRFRQSHEPHKFDQARSMRAAATSDFGDKLNHITREFLSSSFWNLDEQSSPTLKTYKLLVKTQSVELVLWVQIPPPSLIKWVSKVKVFWTWMRNHPKCLKLTNIGN